MRPTAVLVGLIAFGSLAAPTPADAQTDNHFAVGLNVTQRIAQDPDAHGRTDWGLTWRLGHNAGGWGWAWGFNWFETTVDQTVGGGTVALGDLHLRPFMAGYGYTRVIGRTAVSGEMVGGYAIASIRLRPEADDALRDRLGARSVSIDAANPFVLRPQLNVWYDISDKIGLNVSASYILARPTITVSSSLGDDERRYRADMLQISVGAVYSVF